MRYTTAGLLGLALFGLSLQPCFSQGAPQADRLTASSDTRHGRPAAALNAQRPDKLASSSNSLKGEVNAWTVGVAGGCLRAPSSAMRPIWPRPSMMGTTFASS